MEKDKTARKDSALPFVVKSVELLEQSAKEFEVIAFPEYVPAGRDFAVFVKTCRADVELNISCAENITAENFSAKNILLVAQLF